MQRNSLTRLTSLLLVVALAICAPMTPALARGAEVQTAQTDLRFDPRTPRESLLRLVADTERFARVFQTDDAVMAESLANARRMVLAADESELAAFETVAPQLDRVMRVMAQVRSVVEQPPSTSPAPDSPGFPDAVYPNVSWAFDLDGANEGDDPDDLPGGTGGAGESGLCTSARQSNGALFLLLNGTLLAEAVQMVASRICDQVVVVIGGGNGSLVCIITDLIYLAVRGASDNINLCESMNDGAELHASYLRLGHLHTDLEDGVSSVNQNIDSTELNLTNLVNANTTSVLNQVLSTENNVVSQVQTTETNVVNQVQTTENNLLTVIQAGQDFTLRLEIEKALRFDTRIASLYLPEAFGGKLGLVRSIVVETMQRVRDSGEGVIAADTRLAEGDLKASQGLYKDAFHRYARAYFDAVRIMGDEQ